MTGRRHTIGPWSRSGANTVHSRAEGVIVCFVGTADEEVRRFSGERQDADADLIAAAPCLLAACEAVDRECLVGRHWSHEARQAVEYLRASVRRAKGGGK